ncbi:MAG: hypothetical protein H0X37_06145 [Herpetosiphonaceae bacterium]|nr:hypothetical protein [Herpetosiphonaceae bacterium]
MRRIIYLPFLVTVCLAVTLLLPISRAHAESAMCFKETGQCISGRFRQYWGQNGGLPVFGFPVTPAQNEQNRDTGQTYLTQWFERARFELHPENAAPYDVLLGRLGADRVIQQGTPWLLNTAQGPSEDMGTAHGCLFFRQTKHFVCDQDISGGERPSFKTYWLQYGLNDRRLNAYDRSLALFGLPLTDAFTTVNANGDWVMAQIFERARFEYHEDNPEAFKVLLGLLGNEIQANPGDAWAIARKTLPADVPLYRPSYLPKGFEPGAFLSYVRRNDARYGLMYVMPGGNPAYGFGKNHIQLSVGPVEGRPLGSREPIMVHGITGKLYTGSLNPQYWVTWQEGGYTYHVQAFGDQVTRDDMVQMVQSLQPVR